MLSDLTFATYRAKPHIESFDDFIRGDKETQEKVFNQWNTNGTGPLATNGIEVWSNQNRPASLSILTSM
jgi:hypothetical protein